MFCLLTANNYFASPTSDEDIGLQACSAAAL